MTQFNSHLRLCALLVLVASVVAYAVQRKTYSGYAVYSGLPQDENQIKALKEIQFSRMETDGEVDFWKPPASLNKSVDIMVSPEAEDYLRTKLRVSRVPFKKVVHDLGEVIKRTSTPRIGAHRDGKNLTRRDLLEPNEFYANYQTYSMIEAKLKALAASDSRVKLEEVGSSYEKRPLYLVKVSAKPEAKRPVVFIDAGHHAREWASHSTILYVLETYLGNKLPTKSSRVEPGSSFNFSSLLDQYDFWMMPVVNPDGYEYSHRVDRLWRKTRSRNGGCNGVDPNRNYPFMWQQYMCHPYVYSGPKSLSEPETEALANVLLKSDQQISMYISLHSYAGMILFPYGYSDDKTPENIEDLVRVADAGAIGFASLRGTSYNTGPAVALYPAAGGSDDFAYASANIKLSYTIELAPIHNTDFRMPREEIVPTGQEAALGIAAMVKAI